MKICFSSCAIILSSFLVTLDALEFRSKHSSLHGRQPPSLNTRATDVKSSEISFGPNLFKRAKLWTAEEERRLIQLREEDGLSWKSMQDEFPERTWKALSARYGRLTKDASAPKRQRTPWSDGEDRRLRELVKKNVPWKETVNDFPGRSVEAIKAHYYYLTSDEPSAPELVRKRYTTDEDNRLLALKRANTRWDEIYDSFPDRSEESLRYRYYLLTRPPSRRNAYIGWTPDEEKKLIEALEAGKTRQEIAKALGRTLVAVNVRIEDLRNSGLLDPAKHPIQFPPITAAEYELIRKKRAEGMGWRAIARQYFPGRSEGSIGQQYRGYLKKIQAEEEKEKE